MKPIGMSASFKIITPTTAENLVWEAVQAAILEGMTPKQFREEAAEAWECELKDQAKRAAEDLCK